MHIFENYDSIITHKYMENTNNTTSEVQKKYNTVKTQRQNLYREYFWIRQFVWMGWQELIDVIWSERVYGWLTELYARYKKGEVEWLHISTLMKYIAPQKRERIEILLEVLALLKKKHGVSLDYSDAEEYRYYHIFSYIWEDYQRKYSEIQSCIHNSNEFSGYNATFFDAFMVQMFPDGSFFENPSVFLSELQEGKWDLFLLAKKRVGLFQRLDIVLEKLALFSRVHARDYGKVQYTESLLEQAREHIAIQNISDIPKEIERLEKIMKSYNLLSR